MDIYDVRTGSYTVAGREGAHTTRGNLHVKLIIIIINIIINYY